MNHRSLQSTFVPKLCGTLKIPHTIRNRLGDGVPSVVAVLFSPAEVADLA